MKIAIIDNFDSFVYNIVRYVKECNNDEIIIQRNNQIDYDVLDTCDAILLSPGPGIPSEAGELLNIIKRYSGKKKMLGVCLGHQAIAEVFGGELEQCEAPIHGKSTLVKQVIDDALFVGVPTEFQVGRYHSWRINSNLPSVIKSTVVSDTNEIMAIRHESHNTSGVQFHPESILTPFGRTIINNWIQS
jgi:anthranilate synthase component 2